MRYTLWSIGALTAAGLWALTAPAQAGEPAFGTARITDAKSSDGAVTVRAQGSWFGCNSYSNGGCDSRHSMSRWWDTQCMYYRARNLQQSKAFEEAFRCKFGYFYHTGCGGYGCPKFGMYHMVYAADPYYTNPHDTQVYAAQGYGVPVSVPLAPYVEHAYNYGWGLPASRLTPISTVAPY